MTLRERIMEYLTDWGPATVAQLSADPEIDTTRHYVSKVLWLLADEHRVVRDEKVETKTKPAYLWRAP